MLSIDEIKNISFRRASIGGYRPEDVDNFIDQVLITMEQLRKEKSDLVKKMDILATRVEEYRAEEDAVRNAILSAQKVADSTIKEARAKAARMIEESENLAKAKLYDLNVQIKQQKKQYTLLLAECNRVRDDIVNNCNKHIVIANELPSIEKLDSMEQAINQKYPTSDKDNIYEVAPEINTSAPTKQAEANETPAPAPAPVVEETKAPKNETAASPNETAVDSVSLIEDLDSRDNFDVDHHKKTDKKKIKNFGALKFGDDYDFESDEDNN